MPLLEEPYLKRSLVFLDILDFSVFTILGNIMVQYVYNKEE
jgi:hypothetical protein